MARDDFEALLHRQPSVAYAIAQGLTQRVLNSESKFLCALAKKDLQLNKVRQQGHIIENEDHDPETVETDGKADEQQRTPGPGIPRIQIKTFGNFQVFRGEALIGDQEWKAKQRKLLLKAIITLGAEGVPKDVLIEELWPEMSPSSGESNFKVLLHKLRKTLEPSMDKAIGSSYVVLRDSLVSLRRDLCQVDLGEFLILRKQGKKPRMREMPSEPCFATGHALICTGAIFFQRTSM